MNDSRKIITIEAGKRGGKPCIRGMRITVGDVLEWLPPGMSHDEILSDFLELTEEDIRGYLTYATPIEGRRGRHNENKRRYPHDFESVQA